MLAIGLGCLSVGIFLLLNNSQKSSALPVWLIFIGIVMLIFLSLNTGDPSATMFSICGLFC